MYAIIESGSKQYRVEKDALIAVELLEAVAVGQEVTLSQVLLVADEQGGVRVGTPFVEGCCVKALFLAEVKGEKVTSVKYKQRKNERRKFGHRQRYAQLKILDIIG